MFVTLCYLPIRVGLGCITVRDVARHGLGRAEPPQNKIGSPLALLGLGLCFLLDFFKKSNGLRI